MSHDLEKKALSILETLEGQGFEAYMVGGCVRDKVWGKPVKDIDIATSALPEQVMELFEKTIPTGLKHGTVTVMRGGVPYEVTTYRTESGYADYRRPSEVTFISDLHEDLRRRDFTMNAMAQDARGQLVDPFRGRSDMEAGILRCVGDPHERFQEDALRMLRAIRFASTYGLEIEGNTWNALVTRRDLLRHVSMERVRAELDRMMAGPAPAHGWRLLQASGLLHRTKLELSWGHASDKETSDYVSHLDAMPSDQRYLLLLLDSGLTSSEIRLTLQGLTFSNKDLERVARCVQFQEQLLEERDTASHEEVFKRQVVKLGVQAAKDWLTVRKHARSERLEGPLDLANVVREGQEWLARMPVTEMKQLKVAGQDVVQLFGAKAGPWVGKLMNRLLVEAAQGLVSNKREELLERARFIGMEVEG